MKPLLWPSAVWSPVTGITSVTSAKKYKRNETPRHLETGGGVLWFFGIGLIVRIERFSKCLCKFSKFENYGRYFENLRIDSKILDVSCIIFCIFPEKTIKWNGKIENFIMISPDLSIISIEFSILGLKFSKLENFYGLFENK